MNTSSPVLRALLIGVVIGIVVWAVTHQKPRAQPGTAAPAPKVVAK